MPNYMLDAMQGYKFVNDINNQNEDRDRRSKMDARDDAVFDAKRARNDAMLAGLNQQPQQQPQQQDPQMQRQQQALGGWKSVMSDWGIQPDSPQAQMATAKIQHLIDNPAMAGEALALSEELHNDISNGKLPDQKKFSKFVNYVEKRGLEERNGPDGLGREVRDTVLSPSGRAVMFDLNITDRNTGRQYTAPATVGKSADPKDDQVQEFPIKDVLTWFGGSREALIALVEAESRAGLTTTRDEYEKYKEKQRGRGDDLAFEVKKYKVETGLKPYAYNGTSVISKDEFAALPAEQRSGFTPIDVRALKMADEAAELNKRKVNSDIGLNNSKAKQYNSIGGIGGGGSTAQKMANIANMEASGDLTPEEAGMARKRLAGLPIAGSQKISSTEKDGVVFQTKEDGSINRILPDSSLKEIAAEKAKAEGEAGGKNDRWVKERTPGLFAEIKAEQESRTAAFRGASGPAQQQGTVKDIPEGSSVTYSNGSRARKVNGKMVEIPSSAAPSRPVPGIGSGLPAYKGNGNSASEEETLALAKVKRKSAAGEDLAAKRDKEDRERLSSGLRAISAASSRAIKGDDATTIEQLDARYENGMSDEEYLRQYRAIKGGK